MKQDYDVLADIKDTVLSNKSSDIFIVGQRGKGKSTLQLSIQSYLQPDFTREGVVYSLEDYIDKVNSQVPGDVIVFDESGMTSSGTSSRSSMSQGNKQFQDIWQMIRTKRVVTIFVSLDVGRVDLRIRDTFKYYVFPIKQLSDNDTGYGLQIAAKVLGRVDTFKGDHTDSTFESIKTSKGEVDEYVFFLPSQKLIKEYEQDREVQLNKQMQKNKGISIKL